MDYVYQNFIFNIGALAPNNSEGVLFLIEI